MAAAGTPARCRLSRPGVAGHRDRRRGRRGQTVHDHRHCRLVLPQRVPDRDTVERVPARRVDVQLDLVDVELAEFLNEPRRVQTEPAADHVVDVGLRATLLLGLGGDPIPVPRLGLVLDDLLRLRQHLLWGHDGSSSC
jgi:hypothetical protein